MTDKQREVLARGLIELANLVAAALVIGQFVAGQVFRIEIFIVGLACAIALYLAGIGFAKEREIHNKKQ